MPCSWPRRGSLRARGIDRGLAWRRKRSSLDEEEEEEAAGSHGRATDDAAAAARGDRRQDRGGRPVRHVRRPAAADQEGNTAVHSFFFVLFREN